MWIVKSFQKFKLFPPNLVTSFNMSTAPKKPKIIKPKLIGTHNGSFHCDEVFACYMLQKLFPDTSIIRSRDPSKLSACDIVVDVGGVYDPEQHRFDHHQKGFCHTMATLDSEKAWKVKLSSAGLVYFHFGRDIISLLIGKEAQTESVESVYDKVYENFVQAVDAIDNGLSVANTPLNYFIKTDLSSRVADLNPAWNDAEGGEEEYVRGRFGEAMLMVGKEFEGKVAYYSNSWLPARNVVKEAYDQRFEVSSSGQIMVSAKGGCPWKEHLMEIEDAAIKPGNAQVKYVLYADSNGSWRIQCVPVGPNSFENRLSLPEGWRGLRGEELSAQVGVEGCVFVHAGGFIGGHENRGGALCLAEKALAAGVVG